MDVAFLPKLLLQHDWSPQEVLEDVQTAFLQALRQRAVHACASPSGDGLAVALGQRLVVLRGLNTNRPPSVEFVSAVDAPEAITALTWLAGGGAQPADECIIAGTSAGFLQLHSPDSGALLLRQQLHHAAATSAAVRWSGTGLDPEDMSEDVTVAFADAVVRLPAWEVWAAVRWAAGRSGGSSWWHGSGGGDGSAAAASHAHHQLTFSKFQLPKGSGGRSQAVCLGAPPASLYAELMGRPGRPRLRMLTAGANPPLAAYEGEEVASHGLLSLVSDLASSTAQSLLGAARSYVPGPAAAAGRTLLRGLRRGRGDSTPGGGSSMPSSAHSSAGDLTQLAAQQGQQAGGGRGRDKIPGEPASLAASVWDEKRCINQMVLSPCGQLAACCDSLGRVTLVDTHQTLAVRMLKGYREAQVAWLVCSGGGGGSAAGSGARRPSLARHPLGGSASSLDSSCYSRSGSALDLQVLQLRQGPAAEQQQQQQPQGEAQPAGRAPGCRHVLVTFAPRRAAVEAWNPHTLTRLAVVRCSVAQGLLVQQPARPAGGGVGAAAVPAVHACNRCWLLDAASLMLIDLTDTLLGAL